MTRRYWTDAEDVLLAAMYPHCHTDDVAAWVGRTVRQCYQHAGAMGLHKDADYLTSDAACRVRRGKQHPSMIASRFQRGHATWNKGRPGAETGTGTHPNSIRTQFRKGRKPQEARNYQPIGAHRVSKDGYLERKVTDDHPVPARRWTAVHRLVWEAERGPIPAGHIVRFREGMKTTVLEAVTADRLECITRGEHAKRNHPRNHSPELAQLVQLKGAITRQVNRISREAQEQHA